MAASRLAAEADEVIQVEQVEPRGHVFALGRGLLVQLVKVLARLRVAGHAPLRKFRPGGDFRVRRLVLGVLLNPFQDFAVSLAGRQLLFPSLGLRGEF